MWGIELEKKNDMLILQKTESILERMLPKLHKVSGSLQGYL